MHEINDGGDHGAEGRESRGGHEVADEEIVGAEFRHRGHDLVGDRLGQSPAHLDARETRLPILLDLRHTRNRHMHRGLARIGMSRRERAVIVPSRLMSEIGDRAGHQRQARQPRRGRQFADHEIIGAEVDGGDRRAVGEGLDDRAPRVEGRGLVGRRRIRRMRRRRRRRLRSGGRGAPQSIPQAAQHVTGKQPRRQHRSGADQQPGNKCRLDDRRASRDNPNGRNTADDARPENRAGVPIPRVHGRRRQRGFSIIGSPSGERSGRDSAAVKLRRNDRTCPPNRVGFAEPRGVRRTA